MAPGVNRTQRQPPQINVELDCLLHCYNPKAQEGPKEIHQARLLPGSGSSAFLKFPQLPRAKSLPNLKDPRNPTDPAVKMRGAQQDRAANSWPQSLASCRPCQGHPSPKGPERSRERDMTGTFALTLTRCVLFSRSPRAPVHSQEVLQTLGLGSELFFGKEVCTASFKRATIKTRVDEG